MKSDDTAEIKELVKLHRKLSKQLRNLVEGNVLRKTQEYKKATAALEKANKDLKKAKQGLEKVAKVIKTAAKAADLVGKVAALAL